MIAQTEFSAGPLRGRITVPGDKSISHRALILAAKSREPVEIRNLNPGRDVLATREALQQLGVKVEDTGPNTVRVHAGRLHDASNAIDCMNSGSTARMLLGVCAGAGISAELTGDDSLRRRPMEPVAAQLRAFGARINTTEGHLPATVQGISPPQTRRFILLAPSAQVKTALLLAGVFAEAAIAVRGDNGSRDHTERLLRYYGADISFDRQSVELRSPPNAFTSIDIAPDFSAAAFFIVAATVAPGSRLTIEGAGVNPSRTGLLDALLQMGAHIRLENSRERYGEPLADIVVESSALRGISIGPDLAVRAIDEIPVLAVAAAFARGETRITGVRDLRNKESDRVAAIERLLGSAGIAVETMPDAMVIAGGQPRARGTLVETRGDHRTAMAAAALASGAGTLAIDDESSIEVSFPSFVQTLRRVQQ